MDGAAARLCPGPISPLRSNELQALIDCLHCDEQSAAANRFRCVNPRVKSGDRFVDVSICLACDLRQPAASRENVPKQESGTAVIVISHNYGRFLGECLESVLGQSVAPAEVLVVDDSSSDETLLVAAAFRDRRVRWLRVNARHVHLARMAGLKATIAPYIVFLDADDRLPPDYLRAGEAALEAEPTAGVAYCDVEQFGLWNEYTIMTPGNIEQRNWIVSAAMARREALTSIRLPERGDTLPCQSHADWFLWRSLLRAGWKAVRSKSHLQYRRHGSSMVSAAEGCPESYRVRANLDLESIQIVLPLAGRARYLDRLLDWCERQTWPRVSFLVLDTGNDPALRQRTRQWLVGLNAETQYVPLAPTGPAADLERRGRVEEAAEVSRLMPQIYNAARTRLNSEYVFWLEDDVLPPMDVISQLMDSMEEDVGCVSAVIPSRWEENRVMAWGRDLEILTGRGHNVASCWGTGFGALLVRRSAIWLQPFCAGGRVGCYDHEFAAVLERNGLRWLIDWEVGCDHAGVHADRLSRQRQAEFEVAD